LNYRSLLIAAIIFGGASFWGYRLMVTRQPPRTFSEPPAEVLVDVLAVVPTSYQVTLMTRGQVKARTQSAVVPEVSGTVLEVAPSFREGGFFEQGDLLLKLDDRDYKAAWAAAKSALAAANTLKEEEKARSQQAMEDWKRLGRPGEPGPLVSRLPHVAEATAKADSAQAQVDQAARDMERTTILAPYKGRVLAKTVDVGQYVTEGREIGSIFAVDYAEISLPLSNDQLEFIDLPEAYRGESENPIKGPEVTLTADVAGQTCKWTGRVIRSSGVVDSSTLQSFVTVQVDDPYGRKASNQPPLKVGQWVEAAVTGRRLENVVIIPRKAVREGTEVLIVDDQSRLRRRQISRIYSDEDSVVIREGLKPGELLCVTAMAFAVEGAKVKVQPAAPGDKATDKAGDALQTGQPAKAESQARL
jgi:RND family efflux transporter MFP subunit